MLDDHLIPMTQTGYDQIKAEIADLQEKQPGMIQNLKEAAALGDRSENAEYTTAKRDLRRLQGRIHYLTKQINFAKIVEPKNDDQVEMGKLITILFPDETQPEVFEIVGKEEADLDENKLSFNSPIAKALLGHKPGDHVQIEAPNGNYTVQIVAVNRQK